MEVLAYFGGDELAASTWLDKYAMKGKNGQLLEKSPEEMHRRLAAAFLSAEQKLSKDLSNKSNLSEYGQARKALDENQIFHLFDKFRYLVPQGSVMAAAGNPFMLASLSNCVVLPELFDSYGGILFADQQLAQLFKRRCGVGLDISTLRPKGNRVSNAAGTTSGAVSFMERFSNTTREVAQNGRRGALMITMDIAHPDIEDFISAKQDLTKITGANISVRLSDEFMKCVKEKRLFELRWPVDSVTPTIKKTIQAEKLWNEIIRCAHATAEPGIIFWDRQHLYSTSSIYPGYKNISTNPCSEIAMQGGDSCRLMALNLFGFVNKPFTTEANFDFDLFYRYTYEAQRLMDDLVEMEIEAIDRILEKIHSDPEPDYIKDNEIRTWNLLRENGIKGRRTGLGFTALADTLAALGIKFDSDAALEMVKQIMQCKCRAEFDSSIDMAIERGSFKDFNPEIEKQSLFVRMLEAEFPEQYERMMQYGRRNISISTVAPTGTLSLMTQTSSGIEPVFKLSYIRRKKINSDDKTPINFTDISGDTWEEFTVHHPKYQMWQELQESKKIKFNPYENATAGEINWEKRLQLQALVQKYTTHSISSTINLPETTTPELVSEIYFHAWEMGLKGITIYREGSRSGVLINEKSDSNRIKRPKRLSARVMRFNNGTEKWIAFIGTQNEKPYEIFTGREENEFSVPPDITEGFIEKVRQADGKARYDFHYHADDKDKILEGLSRSFNPEYWNYAKLISGILRQGMPLDQVVYLVENLNLYSENINTWKNGVARALRKFIQDGTLAGDKTCPNCNDPNGLVFEEGCLICKSCGHSVCG